MVENKKYFFDKPRNVSLLLNTLYFSCAVLLLLDFIIRRHVTHNWEGLLGFYSIYGFIGCTAIVFGSKLLRTFVQRDENYYEQDEMKNNAGESNVDS